MAHEAEFTITLERVRDYEFTVRFEGLDDPVTVDEPAPLGRDGGPSASRLLAASVGHCLSASLLFCLQKARVPVTGLRASVRTELRRNEQGRLRIGGLTVTLELGSGTAPGSLDRCLSLFEDYCTVTDSVRHGIPVAVTVTDTAGHPLSPRP